MSNPILIVAPNLQLQWGRDLLIAEIFGLALYGIAALYRFNGAAIF